MWVQLPKVHTMLGRKLSRILPKLMFSVSMLFEEIVQKKSFTVFQIVVAIADDF